MLSALEIGRSHAGSREDVDGTACALYKSAQMAAGAIPPPLFFERRFFEQRFLERRFLCETPNRAHRLLGRTVPSKDSRKHISVDRAVEPTAHRPDQLAIYQRRRTFENMANTTSAKKATRKIARRTEINKSRRTQMRGSVRLVEEAIKSGDRDAALKAMARAEPELMQAAQRNIVHKNNASRKVSRLVHQIAKLAR
jgi:small subunit ribosomal protein S20